MFKSGINPEYEAICNFDFENDLTIYKRKLPKNVFGYFEPLGFDGEECPFHKQLLREKSINKLLD